MANAYGFTVLKTDFKESENQLLMITNEDNPKKIEKLTKTLDIPEPGKKTSDWVRQVKGCQTTQELTDFVSNIYASGSEYEQSDLSLRYAIAKSFFDMNEFDMTISFCLEIIESYSTLASQTILLLAKCYRKTKNYQQALTIIERAIRDVPGYDALYLEKCFILAEMNRIKDLEEAIKNYLKVSVYDPKLNLIDILK